jgi:hypothetical protein
MNTRICSFCKSELPLTSKFFSKKGIGFQTVCKVCQKEYKDKHYRLNKEKYLERNRRVQKQNYDWLKELKSNLQCEICGEVRPWVLDFHHKDPSKKDKEISKFVGSNQIKKAKEELKKCIVLCSNCHRDLHHKEKMSVSSNGRKTDFQSVNDGS